MTERWSAIVLLATVFAVRPAEAQAPLIVIDPGHGGADPGSAGNGVMEAAVALDTSLRFAELLELDTEDARGGGAWRVLMTRSDDSTVSLAARAAYANSQSADRFMSIHANAFSSASANGTETFSLAAGTTGAALRDLVQEEMIATWGLTDRGSKTANFAVLRDTSMPSELHELGFVTSSIDAMKLGSPAERQRAAEAHLRALQRHYGLVPYVPQPGSAMTGTIAGSVVDDRGPLEGASVLIDGNEIAITAGDGAFGPARVSPGEHVVRASAPQHAEAEVVVTVIEGGDVTVELALEPQVDAGCGCAAERGTELTTALGLLVLWTTRRKRRSNLVRAQPRRRAGAAE